MVRRIFVLNVGWLFLAAVFIIAQDQKEPTARELFYGGSTPKGAVRRPAADGSHQNPNVPGSNAIPKAPERRPTPNETPSATNTPSTSGNMNTGVLPARLEQHGSASADVDHAALGLRYSVLKRTAGEQFAETDVNTIFRSGDGIRVTIESNDDAYLYIVNKGSSGTWSVLFPSPDMNGGSNRVQAHQRLEVPAVGQFTFVDQPGEERVFVVLSRPPEADLEQLISSLSREDPRKDLAQDSISDEFIGKLRSGVVARDLIFEKVGNSASATKEQANYVVNVNGLDSSRVVADVSLQHK